MNRTIQNYQKAYRKKVEGLKTELTSTRADNQLLRGQVRRLRRRHFAHAPSVAIGAVVGVLLADHVREGLRRLRERVRKLREGRKGSSGSGEAAAAAPAAAAAAAAGEADG